MATWGSIVKVAQEEAFKLLIVGPVKPMTMVDRLLILVEAPMFTDIAVERNSEHRCASVYCEMTDLILDRCVFQCASQEEGEDDVHHTGKQVEDGGDLQLAFCSEDCARRHRQIVDGLPPTSKLQDDPAVVHTVKTMFPQLFAKVNVKALLEGDVAAVGSTGLIEVKSPTRDKKEKEKATGDGQEEEEGEGAHADDMKSLVINIKEREIPPQGSDPGAGQQQAIIIPTEGEEDIGNDLCKYMERQVQLIYSMGMGGSTGSGSAPGVGGRKRRRLLPQLEALSDFSSLLTDDTRALIRRSMRKTTPSEFEQQYASVPVLHEAITLYHQCHGAGGSACWGVAVGLSPCVVEASQTRCTAFGDSLQRRLGDLQVILRLSELNLSVIKQSLLVMLLPTFQFPEPLQCATSASWTAMLALLLLLSAFSRPKGVRDIITGQRSKEFSDLLDVLGFTKEYLQLFFSHL